MTVAFLYKGVEITFDGLTYRVAVSTVNKTTNCLSIHKERLLMLGIHVSGQTLI